MGSFSLVLIFIGMAVVLGALGLGLWQMVHNGPDARRKSNKMMKIRVIAQGVVLAVLALVALLSR